MCFAALLLPPMSSLWTAKATSSLMQPKRILVLGGTAEARELAKLLIEQGCAVTTALAGATSDPIMPPGTVRVGGFGGEAGIARYLLDNGIDAVADATHPFAATISRNA